MYREHEIPSYESEALNPLSSASEQLYLQDPPPPPPGFPNRTSSGSYRSSSAAPADHSLDNVLLYSDEARFLQKHDLDQFFTRTYEYFVGRGYWCILVAKVTNLLTNAFAILFSMFVLAFVDWSKLNECAQKEGDPEPDPCGQVLGLRRGVREGSGFANWLVIGYFMFFSALWLWNLFTVTVNIRALGEMSQFYNEELRFADADLGSIEWHQVVDQLVKLQSQLRLSRVKDLTALDITNRIMRKDNYFVAMMAGGLLPTLRLPTLKTIFQEAIACCCSCRSRRQQGTRAYRPASQVEDQLEASADADEALGSYTTRFSPGSTDLESDLRNTTKFGSPVWGMTLEWNLRFCLVDNMFDKQFGIRRDFTGPEGVATLRRRFFNMGLINLCLMPFIMMFMVIFFFLQHAEEIHSKKSLTSSQRRWSPLALLKMREFNELSHFFQRRLEASYGPAQQYSECFPSLAVGLIAQCVSFVAGAVIAVLLLLTFANSNVLTNITVADRTLLWHLAASSLVLAISRSFIPPSPPPGTPQEYLNESFKHTHYMPPRWRNNAELNQVYHEFSCLYMDRTQLFLGEIVSVLLTPFILMFVLPPKAAALVSFVENSHVLVEGVGALCRDAVFELGDSQWQAAQPADPGGPPTTSGDPGLASGTQAKAQQSYLTFLVHHPEWTPSEAGQRLVASVLPGSPPLLPPPHDAFGGPATVTVGHSDALFAGPESPGSEHKEDAIRALQLPQEPLLPPPSPSILAGGHGWASGRDSLPIPPHAAAGSPQDFNMSLLMGPASPGAGGALQASRYEFAGAPGPAQLALQRQFSHFSRAPGGESQPASVRTMSDSVLQLARAGGINIHELLEQKHSSSDQRARQASLARRSAVRPAASPLEGSSLQLSAMASSSVGRRPPLPDVGSSSADAFDGSGVWPKQDHQRPQ